MTDDEIIGLFFARSDVAILHLGKKYGRYLNYVARGIIGNAQDAEEVVNDVYIKAWNSIPPERPNNLKGFVGRMTRQLAINRLEMNMAQKRGGGEYQISLEELSEIVSGEDGDVDSFMLREAINGFLRSLTDEKRRVFIRRYWYMNSISQISKDFDISESKVKSMLMRCRLELKNYLIKEGIKL